MHKQTDSQEKQKAIQINKIHRKVTTTLKDNFNNNLIYLLITSAGKKDWMTHNPQTMCTYSKPHLSSI